MIAQDPTAIGRVAAERLFARIDGNDSTAEAITIPARLIERGSGEISAEPRAR